MINYLTKTAMFIPLLTAINSAEMTSKAGGYLGLQAGLSRQFYDVRTSFLGDSRNENFTNPNALTPHNKSRKNNAFIGGLIAGYGWVFQDTIYTALEANISKEGNKTFTARDSNMQDELGGIVHNESKVLYKRGLAFGLSARLGYIIKAWVPFVKFGFSISRDNIKQELNIDNQNPHPDPYLTTNRYSANKTITSFIIGAGADYYFTNNWLGRLTYEYRTQPNIKLPTIQETANAGSKTYAGSRFKNIRSHTLQLGVVYKF